MLGYRSFKHDRTTFPNTSQPLYNTVVEVQANFRDSYPICVITRVNCINVHIVLNEHLGSSNDHCYIQNQVVTNYVIKRSSFIRHTILTL